LRPNPAESCRGGPLGIYYRFVLLLKKLNLSDLTEEDVR
jgi:hypothetical protein